MEDLIAPALLIWALAAWLTHVIISIQTAKWFLLLIGAIFIPIGCLHGTGIWFGWF